MVVTCSAPFWLHLRTAKPILTLCWHGWQTVTNVELQEIQRAAKTADFVGIFISQLHHVSVAHCIQVDDEPVPYPWLWSQALRKCFRHLHLLHCGSAGRGLLLGMHLLQITDALVVPNVCSWSARLHKANAGRHSTETIETTSASASTKPMLQFPKPWLQSDISHRGVTPLPFNLASSLLQLWNQNLQLKRPVLWLQDLRLRL